MHRSLLVVLMFAIAFGSSLSADEQKANPKPEDVLLTWDGDAVEFCTEVGEVKAKSGWGGSQGKTMGEESVKATLRKRAAALGANVVRMEALSANFSTSGSGTAFRCSDEAFAQQQVKAEEIEKKASTPIVCSAGADCELRWSRVTLWLLDHSEWKLRNVTDNLITTEGPLDTMMKPSFQVTKMPSGDGKTYRIAMRAACGAGDCENLIRKLRANFYDFITAPADTP